MGKKKKSTPVVVAEPARTSAVGATPVELETLVEGDGVTRPAIGDECTVHYVGTLSKGGAMFDSSRKKKMPFTFKLGGGAVIKGWDMGVSAMSLGQRVNLKIAAHVAYGSAGCVDKVNASGTGVIPPDADLVFDVELLDINHKKSVAVLAKYQATLDEYVAGRLKRFDSSAEARATLEAKHGTREAYEAHLLEITAGKYAAEVAKRGADAPAAPVAPEVPAAAGGTQPASREADLAAAVAAAEAAKRRPSAVEPSPPSSGAVGPPVDSDGPPRRLEFDSCFAMFKVEPKDSSEARSPNFPRSLHNAAELFVHLGHKESAARLHGCVTRMLGTLAAGPDGKAKQRLGRACVCWGCGFVGLPTNAAHCSEKGATPAGVCAGCGGDEQTNFVQGIRADGAKLPWIEVPPEAVSPGAAPTVAAEAAAAPEAALEAVVEAPSAATQARPDGEVKPGQLPLDAESMQAAAARGMREHATFEYRGITLEYSELPDAPSNLLFGNVLWPAAETLARLLVDGARGGAKHWTRAASEQLGVPLESLLQRRFGLQCVPPPPSPSALERLGLDAVVPDVSARDGAVSVLEVGAGVGLSGLACHACGARVLLTDGEARLVEALRTKHAAADSTAADSTAASAASTAAAAAACSNDASAASTVEQLRFGELDWTQPETDGCETFDVILGCEVLNPACEGEVHVPRLIGKRLRKRTDSAGAGAGGAAPPCALLLSEVRRAETCHTAVRELHAHGLAVAAFQVCHGRELFEVAADALPAVGAMLLLVATWPRPRSS